jgi:hypothetical protein
LRLFIDQSLAGGLATVLAEVGHGFEGRRRRRWVMANRRPVRCSLGGSSCLTESMATSSGWSTVWVWPSVTRTAERAARTFFSQSVLVP